MKCQKDANGTFSVPSYLPSSFFVYAATLFFVPYCQFRQFGTFFVMCVVSHLAKKRH